MHYFYGTLTSPALVKRDAKPAGGAATSRGRGSMYPIQSEEEAQKLLYYKTDSHRVTDCSVYFKDEKELRRSVGKISCTRLMCRRWWNRDLTGSRRNGGKLR
ncbi:hypothetical protein BDW62DRAFT_193455 [Aspergillus aurantiobrunneus]